MAAAPRDDARWMRRALRLAERGFATPNPLVGCVIVRDGRLVGEGYHVAAGRPHAEAEALAAAGADARGATAYVTLEPCAHFGRTPPCSQALIRAGVARVVAAVQDPDPRVSGRGLAELREAGVAVEAGLLGEEAERLNAAYFHFQRTGGPHVTLKVAMSLDGKIATHTGESAWITGERARRHVHRIRGQAGAVLVGVGTVLADDPDLSCRLPGTPRQPLRVVADSALRTPPESRLARTARRSPVAVATLPDASPQRARALEEQGVEILRIPADDSGKVSLDGLLAALGARGVASVLVEGGGTIHAAILERRLVHRLLWFIAPRIIGGRDAPTPVEGTGAARMAEVQNLRDVRLRRFWPDLLIEAVPA